MSDVVLVMLFECVGECVMKRKVSFEEMEYVWMMVVGDKV